MDISEQKFQDQLAREILLSQKLRLAVVAGLMGFCAVFLGIEFVRIEWVGGEIHPPLVVIVIATLMTLYQLLVRQYINGRLQKDQSIANWVWYVHTGIEISVVTLTMVTMHDFFENPMSILVAPVALAYTILIILSTLHLNYRISLFAGGLAALEFLCLALYLIATSETMADLEPIFRITHVYVTKSLVFFLVLHV
jgi:hypothetical protein